MNYQDKETVESKLDVRINSGNCKEEKRNQTMKKISRKNLTKNCKELLKE